MPPKKTRLTAEPGKIDAGTAQAAPGAVSPGEAEAARIRAIFERFSTADPAPQTELAYLNPFTLLVAVVLSAQATDVSVNKATAPLFAQATTPHAMLALGEDRLRDCIKTIGLFNSKTKNVMALCRILVDRHDGGVPLDRDLLQDLPGVGRKTANVVLNTLRGDPVIAVDTHVFRVSNRIPLAVGATPLAVERGLEAAVPEGFRRHAHHWLILHGRYTCMARRPLCATCRIADLCRWTDKTA
jgi:endonuclease-3